MICFVIGDDLEDVCVPASRRHGRVNTSGKLGLQISCLILMDREK